MLLAEDKEELAMRTTKSQCQHHPLLFMVDLCVDEAACCIIVKTIKRKAERIDICLGYLIDGEAADKKLLLYR